jgi:predicted MFS family arabinose efflux permease
MTEAITEVAASTPARPTRPRLITPALLSWFGISFAALLGFYLPLAVVPASVVARGANPAAAGWVMTVLMLFAVAAELLAARLLTRLTPTTAAMIGLGLMAGAAVGIATVNAVPVVILLSAVRGFGFGLLVVVVAAEIGALLPPERRGEGLGLAGVVAGVPAVAGIPAGLWLAVSSEPWTASLAAAVVAIAGLVVVLLSGRWLPARPATARADTGNHGLQMVAATRLPTLRRPVAVFFLVVASVGTLIAFMPTTAQLGPNTVTLGLLVHSVAATASRLLAGRHGDAHGHHGWLWFGLLATPVGFIPLLADSHPVLILGTLALGGAAFGAAQSASLALMMRDTRPVDLPAVSGLWNATYDLGLGLGPLVFGVAVAYTSQPRAVVLLLVILASSLLPLRRLNRTRPTGPDVNARLRPGRLAAAPDGPNPALAA